MRGMRQLPIRRRMLLVGAVPALLAGLLLTSYHMVNRWSDLRQENQNIAQVILEHIGASAEYPIISGNYHLLKPLIRAALAQPAIVSVQIRDAGGRLVLDEKTERYGELHNNDIRLLEYDIIRPLQDLDEFAGFGGEGTATHRLGTVYLGMSDVFTRDREILIIRQSLLTGLLVVILAAIISRAASATILPPLEKLERFIARLAGGQTDGQLDIDDGAEIGRLQKNANSLAQSLQKAQQDQQAYTAQLLLEQQKTQQASRAKSDFLAMMSHELRTPLNGVVGMLELLDLSNSREEFDDYKRTADQSLTHLMQLLDDVLVVVDTEKKRMPVVLSELNIATLLDTVLEPFMARAEAKQLSLQVAYDSLARTSQIRTDPSLISQAVRHLVDNALKFTEQGQILVQAGLMQKEGQDWLTVQVSDSGIGIAEEQKQRVLEVFAQANSSFSRRYEGLGIGLTITNHICHTLGGDLRIGDAPERGTRVTMEIPVQLAGDVGKNTDGLRRVLVVEDNPVNLKVLAKMLLKASDRVEVSTVESGEACLEQVQRQDFDLIFMDCQMPGLDGFDTTRRLRGLGIGAPVVACTANTTDQIRERCLAAGMNDYLAKPLKVPVLKQILDKWLA